MKAPHYHTFNPTRIWKLCLLSLICGLPFPMIVITDDVVMCHWCRCDVHFVACVFDKNPIAFLNDGTRFKR